MTTTLLQALRLFNDALYSEVAPSTARWYISFDKAGKARGLLASLADELGGDTDITQIGATQLRHWRAAVFGRDTRYGEQRPEKKGGLSIATKRGYIRAVRRFFNWLMGEGLITTNPANRLKSPPMPDQDPKAIEADDFQAMLNAAKGSVRETAVLLFLADTGCRVAGLAGLRTKDLWLDERKAQVWEKGKGGNGKSRWVYFGQDTYVALCAWLAVRPTGKSDYVFLSLNTKGKLSENGVYQLLKRLAKKAGINGRFNPHSFRHAAARDWLNKGGNLGVVSQLLGHSNIAVTNDSYGRWLPSEMSLWHDRLSRFHHTTNEPAPVSRSELADI